jgi:hypothetical protein
MNVGAYIIISETLNFFLALFLFYFGVKKSRITVVFILLYLALFIIIGYIWHNGPCTPTMFSGCELSTDLILSFIFNTFFFILYGIILALMMINNKNNNK